METELRDYEWCTDPDGNAPLITVAQMSMDDLLMCAEGGFHTVEWAPDDITDADFIERVRIEILIRSLGL